MHDCRLHGGRNILFIAIRAVGEDEIDFHPGHGLRRGQRIVGPHRQEHGSQSVGLGAGRSRDRHRQQARNGAAPRAGVDRVGDLVAFGIEVETAVIARGGQAAFGHPDTPLEVFAVRHVAVERGLDADAPRIPLPVDALAADFAADVDDVVPGAERFDELREQGFKAFYVAIGCQGGRLAGIPGEDAEDVTVAVDFLREVNSGKIDALPGRTIVVGGGNVAIDVARNACRLGSEHVEMFCLESEAQMPASEEERREAIEDGAHISCGWGPKEVHLDEAGRVCGITFKRCTRVFDDEGRFAPEYDENDLRRVDADRVVMSIGQSIVWGDLLAGSKVELGRGQGALADPQTYQTAEPDIFVGGDVYTGPSFAIDAIAAGHEAAVSIHRFVQPGSTLTIGRNQRRYTALDRDDVVLESYDNASREVAHVDREREKAAPFSEYVETFTEEQVRAETARCLGCGASIVDPNKCIGCGLCTTKCAFDAIHLDRDRPECSTMVKYEQKLPSLGKYALKRAIKIKFGRK